MQKSWGLKKMAIVLLQSNHVGSFDCEHTLVV
jgi:hypothetical protein